MSDESMTPPPPASESTPEVQLPSESPSSDKPSASETTTEASSSSMSATPNSVTTVPNPTPDVAPEVRSNPIQSFESPNLVLPVSAKSDKKHIGEYLGRSFYQKSDKGKGTSEDKQSFFETGIPEDEDRPFRYLPSDQLETRCELISKKIKELLNQEDRLLDEIKEINEELTFISIGDQQRKILRQRKKCELDRSNLEEKRSELEKELQQISKELERRRTEVSDFNNTSQQVSVQQIYRRGELADDAIINTILYTATFFAELPPNDFKGVVSEFLRGRISKIQNTPPPKSKSEEEQPVPTFTQVDLFQYWQENLSQSSRFLEACYLKAKRESGSVVIDFTLPDLRDYLAQYFQEEQPFFFDEQLERVETLLFHPSRKVADQAIQLLAEAATYQGVDWLLKIAGKASETNYFFERIANLIYQIQLRLEPIQSEKILIPFFVALLSLIPQNAFDTISRLLYLHLRSQSSFNISNAAAQLVEWLRELMDQGSASQKDSACFVLWLLLNQRDTNIYLYDLLELLHKWLPEAGMSVEDYQASHKVALILFFKYCQETLSDVQIEHYGKWPPKYVLFEPLSNNSARLSKLNMLVGWLFYRDDHHHLAIETVLANTDSLDSNSQRLGLEIGFIVLEWFAILYGLDKGQAPNPKAVDFAKDLLKQIILVTDRSEQRQLMEWWTELIEQFLDAAEHYDQQNELYLRKQFTARRVLAKELKSTFKSLQQEAN